MGKYFKYAIGEILLVVIGILIALSINNWNEQRKLKIQEQELLSNLELEFNRKLNELLDKNAGRIANIEDINQLLKIISEENDEITEDQMIKLLQNLGTWYYVNEEFSIIEMLFNSGKINTISNESLKSKLIAWPDLMEEMLEEQRMLKDLVAHRLTPLVEQYVTMTNFVNRIETKNPDYLVGSKSGKSKFPNNFEALIRDRNFESLISYKKLYLTVNYNDSAILIESAESILKLIKDELQDD